MRLSREVNVAINWVLNEIIPPVLRDCRWLIYPAFRILFGSKAALFMDFHHKAYAMSDAEFAQLNQDIQSVLIDRPTDLNKDCIDAIKGSISGTTVLEAGCGRGYLTGILAEHYAVTAVDITPAMLPAHPNIRFLQTSLERLPFSDKAFDTVVCTHTLEHVRDIHATLAELRRVCGKRLIIVLPCERAAFYTFNLHLHFFPYAYSVLALTGIRPHQTLIKRAGDWYYQEDFA